MTAHDPRVTLTGAEVVELARTWFEADRMTLYGNVGHWDEDDERHAYVTAITRIVPTVEDLIAARLAPFRALAEEWEQGADAWGTCSHEWTRLADFRAALDAPEATSQDHDGPEGQGEGEWSRRVWTSDRSYYYADEETR